MTRHKTIAAITFGVIGLARSQRRKAAAKSRNADSKSALANLAGQLRKTLADEASGQVPGSVRQTLNRDATVADGACGTL